MSSWKGYDVTLTLRLSVNQGFARETDAELEGIRPSDAVANAVGRIDPKVFALLEDEGFEIASPIEGEAEEEG